MSNSGLIDQTYKKLVYDLYGAFVIHDTRKIWIDTF